MTLLVRELLCKLGGTTMLPPPGAAASMLKSLPKPGIIPRAVSGFMGGHAPKGMTAVDQAMATVRPMRKMAEEGFRDGLVLLIKEGGLSPEVEELLKEALNLSGLGKTLGAGAQAARGGLAQAMAKVAPRLNTPVLQAAQQGAHALQKSPNSFVSGVGTALHHKAQSPGRLALSALNPVGTAAEAVASGAGHAASKGLVGVGSRLQAAHGPADAVVRAGRAMTPVGQLRNAAGDFGSRVQKSFSPQGMGHKVLTKHLPLAAEIGGAVGVGSLVHAPVGLAGALGKAGIMGAGKAMPALGAALEHAPGAIDAISHKATGLGRGVGGLVEHAGADILGTKKQGLFHSLGARLAGGAPAAAG